MGMKWFVRRFNPGDFERGQKDWEPFAAFPTSGGGQAILAKRQVFVEDDEPKSSARMSDAASE